MVAKQEKETLQEARAGRLDGCGHVRISRRGAPGSEAHVPRSSVALPALPASLQPKTDGGCQKLKAEKQLLFLTR